MNILKFLKENKFLILGFILLSVHLLSLSVESYQMDYRSGFVAIKAFLNGLNPYDNNVLQGAIYNDSNWIFSISRYVYPLPSLFLYLPFGLIDSYYWSKLAFGIFNIFCASTLLLFFKSKYKLNDFFLLLLFFSIPVVFNFERGQVYILIALLMALGYHYKDKFFSGLLIAIPIMLRVYPGLVLLYFIFRKQYKIIFSTIAFSAILLILSGLIFGFENQLLFFKNLTILRGSGKIVLSDVLPIINSNPAAFLQIKGSPLSYTFDHFVYTKNHVLNFLNLFNLSRYQISAICLVTMFAFLNKIKNDKENAVNFYIFFYLTPFCSFFAYTYAMAFYLPFAFYVLSKNSHKFWATTLTLLPLFWPVLWGYRAFYPAYTIGLAVIALWIFNDKFKIFIKE
ncbi:MAG: glycosyltransferase family 87 protein [Candidatus Gastranaerophilales bacterium]|nr:glycosyltransferase family 87 protein [Candidatus Gastranaerophilales bacterium]